MVDKARLYQHGTIGEKVFAYEIDAEPWWRRQKISLICAFCMTPVVSQRTAVGCAPRGALFRLAADQQHEGVCPLNPTEVLRRSRTAPKAWRSSPVTNCTCCCPTT